MIYPVYVSPLDEEDGGGFVGVVPDLPGCMGDGDTPQEAITDAIAAAEAWVASCEARGRDIPAPGSYKSSSRSERLSGMMDQVMSKIEELSEKLDEASEATDNAAAWGRFNDISTAAEKTPLTQGKRSLC